MHGLGIQFDSRRLQTLTMVPTPLVTGTIAYFVLAAILIGVIYGALASGAMSKDNAA